MTSFKLANVLFEIDDYLAEFPELVYREQGMCDYDSRTGTLAVARGADFLTYFNAFPLAKWREYTGLDNLRLHMEVAGGACTIAIHRLYADADGKLDRTRAGGWTGRAVEASDAFTPLDIDIPLDDAVLVGFQVEAPDAVVLRNAYFSTDVPPERIRDVRLALSTTTFKNERYIIPNIEIVRRKVLGSSDAIAGRFHMFVVDNGGTLDAEALSDEHVTVVPNPNVGGSGGFARGMMCALDAPEGYTHVLLMDDDVRVSPESFKRCFNLLSLANDSYADAFVNGAMLQLQHPNILFEDVSFVRKSGGYQRYKYFADGMDMTDPEDLVLNETLPVNGKNSYGAWWFSCIPAAAIRRNGLPLPLFVRCDDVEYGMRCQPTYMTMGGICVWHSAFNSRFRASVDGYLYVRNMMIVIAVDRCSSEAAFMARFRRAYHMYTRVMNYDAAELWLEGMEDYLRGPEFLMRADGAAIMREKGAKNEKMAPIEELDPRIAAQLDIHPEWLGGMGGFKSNLLKFAETLPHDRHWFPDFMLRDEPAAVDYSANSSPWQVVAMRRTLVALDADAQNAHVRTIDRERFRTLEARYRVVCADWRKRRAQVAQEYRDAMPTMTSEAFWKRYLADRA